MSRTIDLTKMLMIAVTACFGFAAGNAAWAGDLATEQANDLAKSLDGSYVRLYVMAGGEMGMEIGWLKASGEGAEFIHETTVAVLPDDSKSDLSLLSVGKDHFIDVDSSRYTSLGEDGKYATVIALEQNIGSTEEAVLEFEGYATVSWLNNGGTLRIAIENETNKGTFEVDLGAGSVKKAESDGKVCTATCPGGSCSCGSGSAAGWCFCGLFGEPHCLCIVKIFGALAIPVR